MKPYVNIITACLGLTLVVDGIMLDQDSYKKILFLTPVREIFNEMTDSWSHLNHDCEYNQCLLTRDHSKQNEADAIVFHGHIDYTNIDVYNRRDHQIWLYYVKETPYTVSKWHKIERENILFNWTASYRHDSTIYIPFAEKKLRSDRFKINKNMATGKEKSVVWLVSHCNVSNKRLRYARELQKYIDVDIYGKCGDYSCIGGKGNSTCRQETLRKYKFYLAFENTNCRDYITEKLWNNSFRNGLLPIVMGAPKSDYTRVTPPNSFIHVDDFSSPQQLAEYLHLLNHDDELYNRYFDWTADYKIVKGPKILCEICKMLHTTKGLTMYYHDYDLWWNNTDTCVMPSEENPYASWKIAGFE